MRVVALTSGSSDDERSREESMLGELARAAENRSDGSLVVIPFEPGLSGEGAWRDLRAARDFGILLAEHRAELAVTLGAGSSAAAVAARFAGVPHVWWPGERPVEVEAPDRRPSAIDDLILLSALVVTDDAPEGLRERLESAVAAGPLPIPALPTALVEWLDVPDQLVESLRATGALVDPRTSRTWALGNRVLRPLRWLMSVGRPHRDPR